MRYPKIGHLPGSRTGPKDRTVDGRLARRFTVEAEAGDRIFVEEKLDGSCVGIAGGIAIGREGRAAAASRNLGRRRFAEWVLKNDFGFLADGEILWGEWLALAHGTRYRLPHGPFVPFDLFAGPSRVPRALLEARLDGRLPRPRLLHEGGALPVADALARLGENGHHGAVDSAEGVVYRLEARGQVLAMAKFVRAGKQDGIYLADHSGGEDVWNEWLEPGRPAR